MTTKKSVDYKSAMSAASRFLEIAGSGRMAPDKELLDVEMRKFIMDMARSWIIYANELRQAIDITKDELDEAKEFARKLVEGN